MTPTQVHSVLDQLTVIQLKQLAREFHLKTSGNRAQLITTLLKGPPKFLGQSGGARFNRDKLTRDYLDKLNNEINNRNDMQYLQERLQNEPDLDAIMFFRSADPTESGEYTEWIIKSYLQGGIGKLEDLLSRVTPALKDFILLSAKKKLNRGNAGQPWTNQYDLNNLVGLSGATVKGRRYQGLEDLLESYREVLQQYVAEIKATQQIQQNAPVVFENKLVRVINPQTQEASCYYGQGTRWCTAATNQNRFDAYSKHGPLYIMLLEKPSTVNGYECCIDPRIDRLKLYQKYQYHHATGSYMDERDQPFNPIEIFPMYGMGLQLLNVIMLNYVHFNKYFTKIPDNIGILLNLRVLSFSVQNISIIPPSIGKLNLLQQLDLSGNQIQSIPPEIGQLHKLQKLDLSGNQIQSIPPEIGQLHKLQKLDLSGNQIQSIPPEIGQLHKLDELWLNENEITDIPPELGHLKNLSTLILNTNKIRSIPPELGQLENLQSTNLSDNKITAIPPELGQLKKLQELVLDGNKYTSIPPEIGQLSNLQNLQIGDHVQSFSPIILNKLFNLEFFALHGTITIIPTELSKLHKLWHIDLSYNQITTIPPELDQLHNLKDLYLNNNKITSIPPELGQLTKLEHLYLENNEITSIPLELGKLNNLKDFNIMGW